MVKLVWKLIYQGYHYLRQETSLSYTKLAWVYIKKFKIIIDKSNKSMKITFSPALIFNDTKISD